MNTHLLKALVLNEWRLRSRRVSSFVILAVVVVLSWLVVADPQSGHAMMVASKQRIAYESQALAFGTNLIASMLFGLVGFYLARGRCQEDLRSGTASVLAATPVPNQQLLLSRWLGAFGFLMALGAALMLTLWVLQLVRGEGPLRPLPYLQMLVFGLGPGLMLCASLGVLSDAWAPLMGKRGDLLYFTFWALQFAMIPLTLGQGMTELSPWLVLDVSGFSPLLIRLTQLMQVTQVSVGGGTFDPSLTLLYMPDTLWNAQLLALRIGSALLALLPLFLAMRLFHRYAPDRVKLREPGGRWRLVLLVQKLLRPLTRHLSLLLRLSAYLPGRSRRLLADVSLILISQPLLGLALLLCVPAGSLLPGEALAGLLTLALALWGVAISEVGSRDHQAGTAALTAAAPGGKLERTLRSAASALALGLIVSAPALLRWLDGAPLQALACVAGLVFVSGAAALLGQLTGGSRSYLALFLFALYVSLQSKDVAWLDLLGLNGSASAASVGLYLSLGLLMGGALLLLGRRR